MAENESIEGTKICKACFTEKNLSDFYVRKDTGARKNVCKKCIIAGRTVKKQNEKLCSHCKTAKPVSEFNKVAGKWLQPYCKPCDKVRKDKHRKENPDRYRKNALQLYYKHRVLKPKKELKKDNPEYLRQRALAYSRRPEVKAKKHKADKLYRQNNPDRIKQNKLKYKEDGRALQMAKDWQAKQKGNIAFVTKKRLRGRIYVALKRGIKSESTMKLLGCSIDFFKYYFQSLFTEGMNWDRYMAGDIVIDHIKPCAKFDLTDPAQQKECFHYTNLQPLWELDNLKKGASYTEIQSKCQNPI